VLKDLLGCERETLEFADGARVADALRFLRGRASNVEDQIWTAMAVAVNLEYATLSTVLHDADEVALLPPVSGGLD
jgi:molybdopterin converting factor small subunit